MEVLLGSKHISVLAQSYGIEVNPHVWGSAIAQSASLQVIASLPITHHSLFPREPILEYDQSSHPFRKELLKKPISLQDGFVYISDESGLGIDVNLETIKKFKTN